MFPPTQLAPQPSGTTKEVTAIKQLIKNVRERTVRVGVGLRASYGLDGTLVELEKKSRTATAGDLLRWRGEWDATVTDYVTDDLVIRGSANTDSAGWNDTDAILTDGTKGGLYRAKRRVPAAAQPREPADDADNWETVARGSWHVLKVATKDAANGTVLLKSGINNSNAQIVATGGAGTVDIKTADCNGKTLFVREYPVCDQGKLRKAMFVMSIPYD